MQAGSQSLPLVSDLWITLSPTMTLEKPLKGGCESDPKKQGDCLNNHQHVTGNPSDTVCIRLAFVSMHSPEEWYTADWEAFSPAAADLCASPSAVWWMCVLHWSLTACLLWERLLPLWGKSSEEGMGGVREETLVTIWLHSVQFAECVHSNKTKQNPKDGFDLLDYYVNSHCLIKNNET